MMITRLTVTRNEHGLAPGVPAKSVLCLYGYGCSVDDYGMWVIRRMWHSADLASRVSCRALQNFVWCDRCVNLLDPCPYKGDLADTVRHPYGWPVL